MHSFWIHIKHLQTSYKIKKNSVIDERYQNTNLHNITQQIQQILGSKSNNSMSYTIKDNNIIILIMIKKLLTIVYYIIAGENDLLQARRLVVENGGRGERRMR